MFIVTGNLVSGPKSRGRNSRFFKILLTVSLFFVGLQAEAQSKKWSDPSAWSNGKVPTSGQDVTIPKGQSIILDKDTPDLGTLKVLGSLYFEDKDLSLTADWILVDGGKFAIGSKNQPFKSNATITINGPEENISIHNHDIGGRFIATANGGILSLYGKRGDSTQWVQLSKSAEKGDRIIYLSNRVDWQPGDFIAIAPTGFKPLEAEKREVVSVSSDGLSVEIIPPLEYRHSGFKETIEGKVVDMRAEVGLLTRNIRIQAPESSRYDADGKNAFLPYGFHGIFLHNTTVNFYGVELVRGGQTGLKARYPFHWHHAGDLKGEEYIKNSSIHESFQRAVVVHGSQKAIVENNVVFDVLDSAYVFSEDGNEHDSLFINNLGILVKRKKVRAQKEFGGCSKPGQTAFCSNDHFQSTQAEARPGMFWGRSYHNTFIGNHAAGIELGQGFFFDDATGAVVDHMKKVKSYTPRLVFTENIAHSISSLLTSPLYGPLTHGNGLMTTRFKDVAAGNVVFSNFTSYKTSNFGVWIENPFFILTDSIIADAGNGIFLRSSQIENTIIVKETSNDNGKSPGNMGQFEVGHGIQIKNTSYAKWPKIKNVTFVGVIPFGLFNGSLPYFKDEAKAEVSGSKVINNPFQHVFKMRFTGKNMSGAKSGIGKNSIIDLDGTLSGNNRKTVFSSSKIDSRSVYKLYGKTSKGTDTKFHYETIVGDAEMPSPTIEVPTLVPTEVPVTDDEPTPIATPVPTAIPTATPIVSVTPAIDDNTVDCVPNKNLTRRQKRRLKRLKSRRKVYFKRIEASGNSERSTRIRKRLEKRQVNVTNLLESILGCPMN